MTSLSNLSCNRNTTFTKDVIWSDASGAPVDLTGYHAYLQVRSHPGRTLILDLSDTTYGLTVDAANSKIVIAMTPEQTAPLTVGLHFYDLLIKAPSGAKYKIIEGRFVIRDTITEA